MHVQRAFFDHNYCTSINKLVGQKKTFQPKSCGECPQCNEDPIFDDQQLAQYLAG